jgi:predicted transposase YdaD
MILGIRGIEESSVYQDIFAKGYAKGHAEAEARGRVEQDRLVILRQGRKKFGQPRESVTKIGAIDDLDRLRSLLDRLLDVSSWDELLTLQGAQV